MNTVQGMKEKGGNYPVSEWKTVSSRKAKRKRMNPLMDPVWRMVREKLEEKLPEIAVQDWISQFIVMDFTVKKLDILYTGQEEEEVFMDYYFEGFMECLYEVLERPVHVCFYRKESHDRRKRHILTKKNGLVALSAGLFAVAAVIAVVGSNAMKNLKFAETFYTVSSPKIFDSVRVIHLSDLHNVSYGNENSRLVERIQKLAPDVIIMSGDMVEQNDKSDETTLALCRKLKETAPVYYIYGNDECTKAYGLRMTKDELDALPGNSERKNEVSAVIQTDRGLGAALEEAGVTLLQNEYQTLDMKGMKIDVYGVLTSNPSAFWPYAGESFRAFLNTDPDHYKLLVCHEPYIFETFPEGYWSDLVLCGHTHGGVIRLPYIGGLYERENGLFPEKGEDSAYIAGKYTVADKPLIVNRGLSNRGFVRINNQPELVVIDIGR